MKQVEVVAAIIKDGGRILATQRSYGDYAGGWEFPGGKIESGETPEQAIVREIREELNATVAVDASIVTVDYDYETFHLHMYCFLCHVTRGQIKLLEHAAAAWLDESSLDSVPWLPADKEVVRAIRNQGILGR